MKQRNGLDLSYLVDSSYLAKVQAGHASSIRWRRSAGMAHCRETRVAGLGQLWLPGMAEAALYCVEVSWICGISRGTARFLHAIEVSWTSGTSGGMEALCCAAGPCRRG